MHQQMSKHPAQHQTGGHGEQGGGRFPLPRPWPAGRRRTLTHGSQQFFQADGYGLQGTWAILRILGQQGTAKIIDLLWTVVAPGPDRRNRLGSMSEQSIHVGLALVRRPAREQIKQRATQAVDVGAVIGQA